MAVPISTIVNVVVAMPPVYPSGTGFSTLMVLGTSTSLPLSIRAKQYYSVTAVGTDFSSTSEEYRAALTFFSQNPRPAFMVIGRRFTAAAGGEMLGSGNITSSMATWRAMAQGEALQLTIDGHAVTLTNMDFSQAANLNGVAAIIEAAMLSPQRGTNTLASTITNTMTTIPLNSPSQARNGDSLVIGDERMLVQDATNSQNLIVLRGQAGTDAIGHTQGAIVVIGASGIPIPHFTFTGSQFLARSGSTGPLSGIQVTTGTTMSGMLGLDDGRSTPGIAAGETISSALDACEAAVSFYGVVLTRNFTDTDALEAAVWVEGHTKVFGHATADQNAKVASSTADFPAIAQSESFGRTMSGYNDPSGLSDYMMVSALARELAVDFSQPNSAIWLKFKQLPGVAPSQINLNDKQVLDGKNSNYYAVFGSYPMFATGVMSNGTWSDQRHGLDFLAQHLADAAFGGMVVVPKIPQTEVGMAYLKGLLDVAMKDMVNSGLIAPGTWMGTGISNVVNTGEFLTTGYKIYTASIASQSEADRQARKAPPITIVCKGAGAIGSLDIFVQFEA